MSDTTTTTETTGVAKILTELNDGVEIAASDAATVASIVSLFNPAMGTAIATGATVAKTIAISANKILITVNTSMTTDEIVAALKASKSANWGITALETA